MARRRSRGSCPLPAPRPVGCSWPASARSRRSPRSGSPGTRSSSRRRSATRSAASAPAPAPARAGGSATGADGLAGAFAGLFKGLAAVLPKEITAQRLDRDERRGRRPRGRRGARRLLVLIAGGASSGVRIDRGMMGRLIALAGLVVAGIAVYHVVSKPGAGAGALSASVVIKPGIWVALLGGVLMMVGGLLTGRTPAAAAAEPVAHAERAPGDAHATHRVRAARRRRADAWPRTTRSRAPALDPFASRAGPGRARTTRSRAARALRGARGARAVRRAGRAVRGARSVRARAGGEPEPYVASDPYAPEPASAGAVRGAPIRTRLAPLRAGAVRGVRPVCAGAALTSRVRPVRA